MRQFIRSLRGRGRREQGQALPELAIGTVFLMFLIIGMYEMGTILWAYDALVNATRESANYAALNPLLSDATKIDETDMRYTIWDNVTKNEIMASNLDTLKLQVINNRPTLDASSHMGLNCAITVTLQYQIKTFTSGISLPWMGRPGLSDSGYTLRYTVGMPIRNADPNDKMCSCDGTTEMNQYCPS